MRAVAEALERRRLLTIVGLSWVNSAGATLADNASVADDTVVRGRIQTLNQRGARPAPSFS